MREHPGITVDLSFDDRYVNLVEQGVDLAVRMGRLADSSLGARCARPQPVAVSRRPTTWRGAARRRQPPTWRTHDCLVYSSVQGDDRWMLTEPRTGEHGGAGEGPAAVEQPVGRARRRPRAGLGLAILPCTWRASRWPTARSAGARTLRAADAGDPRGVIAMPNLQDRMVRDQIVEAVVADVAKEPIAFAWKLTRSLPADTRPPGCRRRIAWSVPP
jgi:hypothetical protein